MDLYYFIFVGWAPPLKTLCIQFKVAFKFKLEYLIMFSRSKDKSIINHMF